LSLVVVLQVLVLLVSEIGITGMLILVALLALPMLGDLRIAAGVRIGLRLILRLRLLTIVAAGRWVDDVASALLNRGILSIPVVALADLLPVGIGAVIFAAFGSAVLQTSEHFAARLLLSFRATPAVVAHVVLDADECTVVVIGAALPGDVVGLVFVSFSRSSAVDVVGSLDLEVAAGELIVVVVVMLTLAAHSLAS